MTKKLFVFDKETVDHIKAIRTAQSLKSDVEAVRHALKVCAGSLGNLTVEDITDKLNELDSIRAELRAERRLRERQITA